MSILMPLIPWIVAGLIACSVALGTLLLARSVTRSAAVVRASLSRPTVRASGVPLWLRVGVALVEAPAGSLGPQLPVTLREAVQDRLRRAGLDEDITPPQFVMLSLTLGVVMAMLGGLFTLPWWVVSTIGFGGALLPIGWIRETAASRRDEVLRELPLYVDMLTLALEAGGSLSVALRVATERSPDSVLRRAFLRVQGDLRAGRSRAEALRALGERLDVPAAKPLVAALIQADSSGGSLAAVLRAQAEQRLNERFARAEKRAMEAPVRMLGPLVLCIFPCTFLILAVPVALRFFVS